MKLRYAHQVSLAALYCLRKEAGEVDETAPMTIYWTMVMKYEHIALEMVRAQRQRNLAMYVKMLESAVVLLFALNHTHYARWLPVHIRDLKSLPPDLQEAFDKGYWTIQLSSKPFSSVPLDQAHETLIKHVKGPGGAIGLTENPDGFRY